MDTEERGNISVASFAPLVVYSGNMFYTPHESISAVETVLNGSADFSLAHFSKSPYEKIQKKIKEDSVNNLGFEALPSTFRHFVNITDDATG